MNHTNHINKPGFELLSSTIMDGNSSDSRDRHDSFDSNDSYSDNYDNCNISVINKALSKYTLNPNDPDYQIEFFWYGFKGSMYNFFQSYKISYNHIEQWSIALNLLKKHKNYDEIECRIRDYMSQYALQLARQIRSNYHDQILISNIKRWDKISNKYKFVNSEKYNKIILLFYIYNDIKQDTETNSFHLIKSIDYAAATNDFDSIIEYAIPHNKSKILEKLRLVPGYNIIDNITRLYPDLIFQDKNIKMNKLCTFVKRQTDKPFSI